MSDAETKVKPITIKVTKKMRKNYAKNLLDRNIATYKKEWLEKPEQIQMEGLRNPATREALIDLKIVDKDDKRVIKIIAEEKDAQKYIAKRRNQNCL